jgi:hypothetical protein
VPEVSIDHESDLFDLKQVGDKFAGSFFNGVAGLQEMPLLSGSLSIRATRLARSRPSFLVVILLAPAGNQKLT